MSSISRRDFLAAGAALVGGGTMSFSSRAQQLRQINFITPLNYLIGYAPTLNAQACGHFAKEGLDVTILPGKGSAVAVQQVIAGRALYGRGDPLAMAKAIGQGAPIVAFATCEHRSPIVIYSSPKKPIRNVQDMVGKTIGIGDYGSASDNILDMMLAMNGLKPDAVKREAIGNSPGGWGLIQQGGSTPTSSASAPLPFSRSRARISWCGRPTTSCRCQGRPISARRMRWRRSPSCS